MRPQEDADEEWRFRRDRAQARITVSKLTPMPYRGATAGHRPQSWQWFLGPVCGPVRKSPPEGACQNRRRTACHQPHGASTVSVGRCVLNILCQRQGFLKVLGAPPSAAAFTATWWCRCWISKQRGHIWVRWPCWIFSVHVGGISDRQRFAIRGPNLDLMVGNGGFADFFLVSVWPAARGPDE